MDTIAYFDKYKKYKSKYLEFKRLKNTQLGGSITEVSENVIDRTKIWDQYKVWYLENLNNVSQIQEMFKLVSEEQKEEITEEIHNNLQAHDNSYPHKPGPVYMIFDKLKVIEDEKLPDGSNFRESFQNNLINMIGNLTKKSSYENYKSDFENILKNKINLSDSNYTDLALVIIIKNLIELFNKLSIITEIPTGINPDTERTDVLKSITTIKNVNGKDTEVTVPTKIPEEIKDVYKFNLQDTELKLEDIVLLYANAVNKLNIQQELDTKCGEVYIKKGFNKCSNDLIDDKEKRIEEFNKEKNSILEGKQKLNEILETDRQSIDLLNEKISEYESNVTKIGVAIDKLKSEKKNIFDRIYSNIPSPTPEEDTEELDLLENDYSENGESERNKNLIKLYEKKFGITGNSIEDLLEALSNKYTKDIDQNPKQTNFPTSK